MLTVLIGKSGSGKNAVQQHLVGEGFSRFVTTTTRPMREGEVDGIDYHFVSKEDFLNKIDKNELIEYRSYNTVENGKPAVWYYGTEKAEYQPDKKQCIIVDVQGSKDLIDTFGKENCFVVSVELSDEVRERRAAARDTFEKAEWDRRLKDDNIKFSPKNLESVVDYHLNNASDMGDTMYDFRKAYNDYTMKNSLCNVENLFKPTVRYLDEDDIPEVNYACVTSDMLSHIDFDTEDIDDSGFYVGMFKHDGNFIGLCTIGSADCVKDYNPKDCIISNVYILPEYRHNGYGSQLVQESLKLAGEQYGNVDCHIDLLDPDIADFYKKIGFQVESTDTFGINGMKIPVNKPKEHKKNKSIEKD